MKNKNFIIKSILFVTLCIIFIILGNIFYKRTLSPFEYVTKHKSESNETLLYEEKLDNNLAIVFYKNDKDEYYSSLLKYTITGYKTIGIRKNEVVDNLVIDNITFDTFNYKKETYTLCFAITKNIDTNGIYFDDTLGNINLTIDNTLKIVWYIGYSHAKPIISFNE